MRGILAGALTLIVLQVFSSGSGPASAGKLIGWVNTGLQKAISPEVAAIPTAKSAKKPAASSSTKAPSTGGVVATLPRNPTVVQV